MRTWIAAVACVAIPACLAPSEAHAQADLLNRLKGATGIGQNGNQGAMTGGSKGGFEGIAAPSVASAPKGNVAGVLGYCMRNKYLGGNDASSVEQSLMGKLGKGETNSVEYVAGNDGMLLAGNGQRFRLGGPDLEADLTRKICTKVLDHAKSLI